MGKSTFSAQLAFALAARGLEVRWDGGEGQANEMPLLHNPTSWWLPAVLMYVGEPSKSRLCGAGVRHKRLPPALLPAVASTCLPSDPCVRAILGHPFRWPRVALAKLSWCSLVGWPARHRHVRFTRPASALSQCCAASGAPTAMRPFCLTAPFLVQVGLLDLSIGPSVPHDHLSSQACICSLSAMPTCAGGPVRH